MLAAAPAARPCLQAALPVTEVAAAASAATAAEVPAEPAVGATAPLASVYASGPSTVGGGPLPGGPGTPTYVPRRVQQQQAAAQLRLAVQQHREAVAEAETIHRPIKASGAAGVRGQAAMLRSLRLACRLCLPLLCLCCSACSGRHACLRSLLACTCLRRPAPGRPARREQAMQASVSQVPLGAIPNYGGKTSEGTNASHHRWGVDRVPTPREIVAHLDQYVIGQVRRRWGAWGCVEVLCGGFCVLQ